MKKIIIDTDIGTDCDDCGALAVAHNLQSKKKCKIIGVMCNIAKYNSAVALKYINEWYGRNDIPIGQTAGKLFIDNMDAGIYTDLLAAEYLSANEKPEITEAVTLYRKLLAANNDVSIISIGFMTNIAELLKSKPDEISSLTGIELVRQSVNRIYIMGGSFNGEEKNPEYNIATDIASAQVVASYAPIPLVYLGCEVGNEVCTGHTLWEDDDTSPIKKSYEAFAKHYGLLLPHGAYNRYSWDPLITYYAITEDSSFMHESEKVVIRFDDRGFTHIEDNGRDTFIILDDAKQAEKIIEQYIHRS